MEERRQTRSKLVRSVIDLVNRAGPIFRALETGLAVLDIGPPSGHPLVTAATRLEYSTTDHHSLTTATRIWAHAAQLYLFVVLSGWQPASADVQRNLDAILTLL